MDNFDQARRLLLKLIWMKATEQELFRKYLEGGMSLSERSALEERLANEAELRRDFELYKEIEGYVGERVEKGAALDVLQAVSKDYRVKSKGSTEAGRKSFLILAFSSILLLLLGVFAQDYFRMKNRSTPVPFAELYEEPVWPVSRSGSIDEVSLAVTAYLGGNEKMAIEQLRKMKTMESQYWLAEIFAKEIKMDSVLKYLPEYLEKKISRDRCNYLRIISYYKIGNTAKCKELLQLLPENTDQYYMKKYDLIPKFE